MIRYTLTCENAHSFESWFQSGAACDRLRAAGMLACTVCGSTQVEKMLMAPSVATSDKTSGKAAPAPPMAPLSTPATTAERALAELRRHVEQNADYVGMSFATEARAIHDGTAPERAIWGEAKPDEARRLIEDGVRVAPLPFTSRRRTN